MANTGATKFKVENLGMNISDELLANQNLERNEYLVVGEKFSRGRGGFSNNPFTLIVDNAGIAVNCNRLNRRTTKSRYATELIGNTYIDGNLILTGLITSSLDSSNIEGGSSNFWRYAGSNNIYYDGTVTVGRFLDAQQNTNLLNIAEYTERNIDRAHFAFQNNAGSEFRMATIGGTSNSPIIINTPNRTPIEFHVNKNKEFFESVYQISYSNYGEYVTDYTDIPYYLTKEYPNLTIDENGNVGINTNRNIPIRYEVRVRHSTNDDTIIYPTITEPMKLHVNGPMYACNILVYDADLDKPRNIDELYIRRLGQTIEACNIIPGALGTFTNGNFIFRSNLAIGGGIDDRYRLFVHGQVKINSNLVVTGNLDVGDDLTVDNINVHNNGSFSNNVIVQNNIYFKANLFKQRYNPAVGSNEWSMIQFDNSVFEKPALSNIFYIGDGIATMGRIGVGIDPVNDEVNHQLVSVKRDPTYYELELMDKSTTGFKKTLYIGHPSTSFDYRSDGSVVFLTPGPTDNNYNNVFTNGVQNMYFYPGWGSRISQFQINSNNAPTLGLFSSQRVGIHTFSPTHELDVNGDIATNGGYYVKLPNELQPAKMGLWRDNSYSYIVGGNQASFKGIHYYNDAAPHVGVNTIPQPTYGMVVGGKLLSTQGYYTELGYRMIPLYNSFEMFGKPTPAYEQAYFNGRIGIGPLFPQSTIHIRDTNRSTGIQLSQSLQSASTLIQFSGNQNNYILHMNDGTKIFELFQGSSNQLYTLGDRPWLVHRTPDNRYQMVINSNIKFAQENPSDILLVNGNMRVIGDVDITGTYRVTGKSIVISGSQAQYTYDNTDPNNIYIAGQSIYMNTGANNGAIFVGYANDIPSEALPSAPLINKSVLYLRQNNTVSQYVTKYQSEGSYCLTEYKNLSGEKAIFGITEENVIYIGKDISTPYVTVKQIGSQNVIGIGTATTDNSKLQVYTISDSQSLLKLTHASGNSDTANFVSDIILEKIVNNNDSYKWTVQGPNFEHRQKLQLMYSELGNTAEEVFTFTKDGCFGIGNTRPEFAIDVQRTGDLGGIRLLQTNPTLAKPQLLFQSGSNQYGADRASDFRMYAFSNNFYLDMQDSLVGEKKLLHFTSNNSLGILQSADSRYNVSIAGSLNVGDSIYLNGRPFFSIGDSLQDIGTFVSGFNIFLNPQPDIYGGVTINGNSVNSNIFHINSGINGNLSVLDSQFPESQLHFRNKLSTDNRRLWRVALSNESFIMEYNNNPALTTYVSDSHDGYMKVIEWKQLNGITEFNQILKGKITLESVNPEVKLNNLVIGQSNENNYLLYSKLGIGTAIPTAAIELYNTTNSNLLTLRNYTTNNILNVVNSTSNTRIVIDHNGNIGIGTTLPNYSLHLQQGDVFINGAINTNSNSINAGTGKITAGSLNINTINADTFFAADGSEQYPSITFKNNSNTGVYYSQNNIGFSINGSNVFSANNHGNIGIGTTNPIERLHIVGNTLINGSILPAQADLYNLGSSNNRWKEIYLSGSSIYLDTLNIRKEQTNILLQNESCNLVPLITDGIILNKLNENTVKLTSDITNTVLLPKFVTSNVSTLQIVDYTPIVLNKNEGTVGIGTYQPKGFTHIYNNSNIPSLKLTQNGTGDAFMVEGGNFNITGTSDKFNIRVTNEGNFTIGQEDTNSRVTFTDKNFKKILYLNQLNDFQDVLQIAHQNVLKTTITKDGYIGIGTANPEGALDIYGTTYFRNNFNVDGECVFNSNLDVYGRTWLHGTVIEDSDSRIKYDIKPIENALDKIKKISGYTFNKLNQEKRQAGVIAQEIQQVLPEVVYNDDNGMLGVSYGNIIGLLIEGIKDLEKEINVIKSKLAC